MQAARQAIDAAGGEIILTGRAENFSSAVPIWTTPSGA